MSSTAGQLIGRGRMPRAGTDVAYCVWVSEKVLTAMFDEAWNKYPNETGGLIFGYEDEAGAQSVVTEVVGPGPEAWHGPKRFEPDTEFHEIVAARIYKASGRRHTYLGDWHTHPDGVSALSARDRTTLRSIARDQRARLRMALMAVLSLGREEDETIGVFANRYGRFSQSKIMVAQVRVFA